MTEILALKGILTANFCGSVSKSNLVDLLCAYCLIDYIIRCSNLIVIIRLVRGSRLFSFHLLPTPSYFIIFNMFLQLKDVNLYLYILLMRYILFFPFFQSVQSPIDQSFHLNFFGNHWFSPSHALLITSRAKA